MADNKKEDLSYLESLYLEPYDSEPTVPSESENVNFIAQIAEDDDFQAVDVSEPRAPRREVDVIAEALAIRRRNWIRSHLSYIFAAAGVIVVALTVMGIRMYYNNTNPLSRFVSAASKDFGTSFTYDVRLTENGENVMQYTGTLEVDRNRHTISALYDADYDRYAFTGALYSDDTIAAAGSLYDKNWTVHDCTDRTLDFFEFDRDFRKGKFNGGAFLRFADLTSDYSTRELEKFIDGLKSHLTTDSDIAQITTDKGEDGTRYEYEIDLYELFKRIQENGASVFYRATDYDKFSATFDENSHILEDAECTVSAFVDTEGYLTSFDAVIVAQDAEYGLSCRMSGFGSSKVELPEDFIKAAAQLTLQE